MLRCAAVLIQVVGRTNPSGHLAQRLEPIVVSACECCFGTCVPKAMCSSNASRSSGRRAFPSCRAPGAFRAYSQVLVLMAELPNGWS
jgi:hypothetical protein